MGKIKKKNLVFIGPLPPPILGESIALKSLYDARRLHEEFNVKKINLNRKNFENPGGLSVEKIVTDSLAIIRSLFFTLQSKEPIIYISISQTKLGLLRDCMIIHLCKMFRKSKVVVHLHGNNLGATIDATSGFIHKFIVGSLRKVDIGIVLGSKLSGNYKGLVDRVEVVSNGIPLDFIKKEELEGRESNDNVSLLYLSNLMVEKGYVELVKAVASLVAEGQSVKLDLVGAIQNENEFQKVKKFIETNNLEESIQYHGVKKGEEKKQFFLKSDLMVLPTKYKVEGQPMSIIEGMAAGLPIISSDRGIIAEMIEGCGVLVEPSVEDLKKAIKQLAFNTEERLRLGKMSRETFENFYTEDKYSEAMINLFNEL